MRNSFQLFLDFEKTHFGSNAVSLSGEPFLASELEYLRQYLEIVFSRGSASLPQPEEIAPRIWTGFAPFLYIEKDMAENELAHPVEQAAEFLKWLSETLLDEVTAPATKDNSPRPDPQQRFSLAVGALKTGQKEATRLGHIYRYLKKTEQDRFYMPAPTTDPDAVDLERAVFYSQLPPPMQRFEDVFEVLTPDFENNLCLIRGHNCGQGMPLKVDAYLNGLLRKGDLLRIKVGMLSSGMALLLESKKPLYPTLLRP